MKHLLNITIFLLLFSITPVSADEGIIIRMSTVYSKANSSSDRVAHAMDGHLDKYADGQINSGRFLEASSSVSR